ncbi:MAG: phosphoribosyltransferase family protein [Chloroflexota bacterium]|nr:phosphoribosyltransferase family protein [Chloroflexota bacterium]
MDEPARPNRSHHREVRDIPGLRAFFGAALASALDLLYPPRCALCGRVDSVLCARCAATLPPPTPLHLSRRLPLTACAATGFHTGTLRRAIHVLKYETDADYARRLGAILAERMLDVLPALGWTFDAVAPVPLHTHRLRERGYNQSQALGAHVAAQLDLPLITSALVRQRNTAPQVGRTDDERRAAMSDAFTADADQVVGKTLLLIDDVCTTGATLQACAAAALKAGAQRVYSLTLSAARS